MKMPEAFSYKPPMTAERSSIKHENHEVIFIGKDLKESHQLAFYTAGGQMGEIVPGRERMSYCLENGLQRRSKKKGIGENIFSPGLDEPANGRGGIRMRRKHPSSHLRSSYQLRSPCILHCPDSSPSRPQDGWTRLDVPAGTKHPGPVDIRHIADL